VVRDTPNGIAPYDRLTFTGRAERPMRISVQLRSDRNTRWRRSVYVGTSTEPRTVFFDDFSAVPNMSRSKPALDQVRSILFVIDTMNSPLGSSGRLWLTSAALQK
jgi:hypothetical protein